MRTAMNKLLYLAVTFNLSCGLHLSAQPADYDPGRDIYLHVIRNDSQPIQPKRTPPGTWGDMRGGMSIGISRDEKDKTPRIVGFWVATGGIYADSGMERSEEWRKLVKAGVLPETHYGIFYPRLKEGDIFPLPDGRMFRVATILNSAVLSPVPDEDVPGRPEVGKDCRILCFGGGTALAENYSPVNVKELGKNGMIRDAVTGKFVKSPIVEITVRARPEEDGIYMSPKGSLTKKEDLMVGMVLQVAGVEYEVKNIVLPDPEKHIIGWVELKIPPFDAAKEVPAWQAEHADWVKRWGPVQKP